MLSPALMTLHRGPGAVETQPLCSFGGGFIRRRCKKQAATDCVYCARPFCAQHGERGSNYLDVCSRKHCQEKLIDLRAHERWKAIGEKSNQISLCGFETCDSKIRHQCSRCQILFCATHIKEQKLRSHPLQPDMEVHALICEHCYNRRKIWD